jgi:hypothetical protein
MKDKLIKLIQSVGPSFETYTIAGSDAKKFSLAKAKANEMVSQFVPFNGEEVTMSDGVTYTLSAKPIGTLYISNGNQQSTKTNSVQLIPVAERVAIEF